MFGPHAHEDFPASLLSLIEWLNNKGSGGSKRSFQSNVWEEVPNQKEGERQLSTNNYLKIAAKEVTALSQTELAEKQRLRESNIITLSNIIDSMQQSKYLLYA